MPCYTCRCECIQTKEKWTRYEFTNYYSDKFWEYKIEALFTKANYTVYSRYGKAGTKGQTSVKEFRYRSDADQYVSEKVHEKLSKGYRRA